MAEVSRSIPAIHTSRGRIAMPRRFEELGSRLRAANERLSPFRGNMCDEDFTELVKDVVRVRDRCEGRAPTYPWDLPNLPFPPLPA
jgi:hypothetical protein